MQNIDNSIINTSYKQLRTRLRKINVYDALAVVWSFQNYLQFNKKFEIPNDIVINRSYFNDSSLIDIRSNVISEWELDTLSKEIILHSARFKDSSQLNIKNGRVLFHTIHKLMELEETIARETVSEDVLLDLFRASHRQFPWTLEKPNLHTLTRYYKVFGTSELDRLITNKTGLKLQQLYYLGVSLYGHFIKHHFTKLPLKSFIDEISEELGEQFLNLYSIELEEMKDLIDNTHSVDSTYAYSFNPLRDKPLIRVKENAEEFLICPIPSFLLSRITGGVYFDIWRESNFDKNFGNSFEKYVGDVLKVTTNNEAVQIIPEHTYIEHGTQKKTVDWILKENGIALFIECKGKRLTLASKAELENTEKLNKDLDIMADTVVQIYKTITAYQNGKYSLLPFDHNLQIFPVIVTLESWYLFGDRLLDKIDDLVSEKLVSIGLTSGLLNQMPYTICSIQTFEEGLQIMNQVGLERFMKGKTQTKQTRYWDLNIYIQKKYRAEFKNVKSMLFIDDFKEIFPKRALPPKYR